MNLFQNTEIAFQHKTNSELKKARLLFKVLSLPAIAKFGNYLAKLALNLKLPVTWIIKPTIFNHFCGGETIDECLKVTEKLGKYNVKAILDYSVESSEKETERLAVRNETLRTIRSAATNSNVPFAVFKPTAFASTDLLTKASREDKLSVSEQLSLNSFRKHIHTLCKEGFQNNVPVLIDAEETFYQSIIDDIARDMMVLFNKKKAIVYNTLQMYRHDREEFLSQCLKDAIKENYFPGIKLVRGAYMERERLRAKKMGYPSPIHPDKESTDKAYNNAISFCIENINKISLFNGSHNEESCLHMIKLMEKHSIRRNDDRAYHSQLYGMSDHISFNLAREGYNVAKYLPYGPVKNTLPYLIRRAEENTSIAGQSGRELGLVETEIRRRKQLSKQF